MKNGSESLDKLLNSLKERAKELNCLYQVEEILEEQDIAIDDICYKIIDVIPPGWQYPEHCRARILLEGKVYAASDFRETEWRQRADIKVQDVVVGRIEVYYTMKFPDQDDGPFLKEETRLIKTIAERIGHRIAHLKMRDMIQSWDSVRENIAEHRQAEWKVIMQMLRQSDLDLFNRITRKMLNHLCWSGIHEAEQLMRSVNPEEQSPDDQYMGEFNQPRRRKIDNIIADISTETFKIASSHLRDDEIIKMVQKWLQEDKLSFLVRVVNRNLSLSEVSDAIRKYYHLAADDPEARSPNERGIQVSLIRRFLSDQLEYINAIKNFIDIRDFYHLLQSVIFSNESHGRLGGKSAGLYLASQILKKKAKGNDLLRKVKVPRSWHITSDNLVHFMAHNNFEEVVEQKYKEINQVRLEYPHIIETFKRAQFPSDILRGLSVALDDFGETPLIVRSSSLLEDRIGAAFSGKYKSLFLANQGSKQERLEALCDAIAEVYASTFSPDPIEYRAERGLLDFGEEMGIIIQEVVGSKVGKYFLPAFAGVAFSKNEFRWSPRIKREDGLLRMVPGLGTRAVDRLSDDYPVLLAPGQPGLRVNSDPDEVKKYSPCKIDVINLETNSFESHDLDRFLKEIGHEFPGLTNVISVYRDGHISRPVGLNFDIENDDLVVTFDGLVGGTSFLKRIHAILQTLEETLGYPVDIEFASDGQDFYLLQCRSQSRTTEYKPAPIPPEIPKKQLVFTAEKHISNGRVPDITHIVYVQPEAYGELAERSQLLEVGRAIGKLNKLLPKRQFILMGPGRWGSRGDIKLGVSVTYSDINNTAALIEIALRKGNYVPDLSFGTHFFQDLVEADIRYIPLYPDDPGIEFNRIFLERSPNLLGRVAPEYAHLENVIRLIDVSQVAEGRVLKILLNADLGKGVALISSPSAGQETDLVTIPEPEHPRDTYWRWRYLMVERIAEVIDPDELGVEALYIFGSTKNATAGPASDIDILVHVNGTEQQQRDLEKWLGGWSQALAEINYMQTGYKSDGLLDVHIITDEDIEKKTSWASKIGAVTDPARPIPIKQKKN